MHDSNKFNAAQYINKRADWSIARLVLALARLGVSRADAQRLLRDFVDAQCSQ